MHWQDIENNWEAIKANVKQHWDALSYQQLSAVAGNRAQFAALIQQVYAINHAEAEQQVNDWQQAQINIDGHFYTVKNSAGQCV